MIRTVVYPTPGSHAAEVQPADTPRDSYGDKLVKYIPAEVIGFYVPAYALAKQVGTQGNGAQGNWAQWVVLALCTLGTVGYLFVRANQEKPPRWYFYLLSSLAFLAWALGTSMAGSELFQLENADVLGKLIVTAAVFLIPLIDDLLTKLLPVTAEAPAPPPVGEVAKNK